MAVGLIVGDWFASMVISKLINELIEYAKDQKKMQLGLKDDLAWLQKNLPKIQVVVNAVDQGLIREENPALEKWLWQLKDAADQADDVMDELKYDYEKERALNAELINFDSHQPDSLVTEMLKGMEKLRLLILFADNLREIPKCVNKLLHLRYLNIRSSRINAVPTSVSRLYLLETMVYDGFYSDQLKQVNRWGRLINLRHLTAPEWWLHNIASIGMLTSLQEFSFNVGKDDGFKICELSDMRDLGRLRINRIENVGSCEEVEQANLKDKINLNELTLAWNPWKTKPNKSHFYADVFDHLEPHHGLEELSIHNYNGTGRPPIWFTTQALSKLVHLAIFSCTFENLPCLEELPLLKYIDLKGMNATCHLQ